MALPNVNITLGNGNIGTVTLSDDGIAGLILTGTAVATKLDLNKVYVLYSSNDLVKLGITKENNPLAYKDIVAFYKSAGDGAELHLLIVSEATTLTQICSTEPGSALQKLVDSATGRIRVVGINRNPPAEYTPTIEKCIDGDVITAINNAQSVAQSYMTKIAPFVVLIPAIAWMVKQKSYINLVREVIIVYLSFLLQMENMVIVNSTLLLSVRFLAE